RATRNSPPAPPSPSPPSASTTRSRPRSTWRERRSGSGAHQKIALDRKSRVIAIHIQPRPPRLRARDRKEGRKPSGTTRRGNEETTLFDIVNRKRRPPGCDAHRGQEAFALWQNEPNGPGGSGKRGLAERTQHPGFGKRTQRAWRAIRQNEPNEP